MVDGTIIKSGDASLALEIEKYGYEKEKEKYRASIGTCAVESILKHE